MTPQKLGRALAALLAVSIVVSICVLLVAGSVAIARGVIG